MTDSQSAHFTDADIRAALAKVDDPEIGRPITELGMVKSIDIDGSSVAVTVYLTIAGCPMKSTIVERCREAVAAVAGVEHVSVDTDVMSDEQRAELRAQLRGGVAEPENPFARPDSRTRVYAVASGKGGVGKSSMTVNLAAALAQRGLSVGILDADIYGHSIPHMLGSDDRPHQVDDMIMPPQAHGIKMISIAHFTEGNAPVVWRGPMLHRAVQQFLSDVFWGDLDVLLLDLPPGTGDVTISVAQLLPNAEILVVTTPQTAAAEVAERTGLIATQTHQKVVGVIENMSYMPQPDGSRLEIFGSGGGEIVSASLSETLGYEVPLLAQLPLDIRLREGSDTGLPATVADDGKPAADAPAALELSAVAQRLTHRSRGLAGKSLGVTPA